ncbi:hypothetical protein LD120_00419 [Mesoplasma sp. JKS002657]|nr:hypothetical protein [Mesoplasma sp. JKS002661]MCL8216161.1 hypothetical protein [Mesoplasma sp. JKS002657]
MHVQKINKEDLNGVLTVIGQVTSNDVKIDEDGNNEVALRLKYSRTTIFLFESTPLMVKRLQKYQKGDVIQISGHFINEWFPGQRKSSLPIITKVISAKKLGLLKT